MKRRSEMTCLIVGGIAVTLISISTARAADDKTTINAVTDLIGITKEPGTDKIDYNERPKLVLPRTSEELPAPREAKERPADWPSDTAAVKHNSDRFARVPGAPPEKPKPGLLERIRGPRTTAAPGTDDEPGLIQKMLTARQRAADAEPDEPDRQVLTEPPNGYRHPTRPLNTVKDTTPKNGFFGKLFSGGGNDGDPVAQTAGTSGQIQSPKENAVGSQESGKAPKSSLSSLFSGFFKKTDDK